MKSLVRRSAFFALVGLIPSPLAVVHAATPPADSVLFCAPFDYEQWRRDNPQPAGKALADRNRGEPRTVRMIYFLPKDRPYRAVAVDTMKTRIRQVQNFYREQMAAHGFGNTTFRFEVDAQGEPLVHRVDGKLSAMDSTPASVYEEVDSIFETWTNVYYIAIDNGIGYLPGTSAAGVGGRIGLENAGYALTTIHASFHTVAHEIGHAFNLQHDFRDDTYIMSYSLIADWASVNFRLSTCNAEELSVNAHFNSNSPVKMEGAPTFEILTPLTIHTAGATSVPIRVRVQDPDGVHQVSLRTAEDPEKAIKAMANHWTSFETKTCRTLGGKKTSVVEFDYDGAIPGQLESDLNTFEEQRLLIEGVDVLGNVDGRQRTIKLVNNKVKKPISTFVGRDGDRYEWIYSIAFSLDSKLLAAARPLRGGPINLWNVSTGQRILTLPEQSRFKITFSPDSKLLAFESSDGAIKIWDRLNRKYITTLLDAHEEYGDNANWHWGRVVHLAFSPDSRLLASVGKWDNSVKVWDVSSGEHVTTIRNAGKVAFSPDGKLLASATFGSAGGTKLWNVETGQLIATLPGGAPSAFSPDGKLLASDGEVTEWEIVEGNSGIKLQSPIEKSGIKLWNVETGQLITTLPGSPPFSFSPDGKLLASMSAYEEKYFYKGGTRESVSAIKKYGGKVIVLWDVATSQVTTTLPQSAQGAKLLFSPNGERLAAWGTVRDGPVVKLWSMSGSADGQTTTGEEPDLADFFDTFFGSGKPAVLPDNTQLLQNAPNPFNSQTVLSYFLLEPGLTRLDVFTLTGQRVVVLHQGPQQAGYHRLHWDGRDDAGRSVASGMYLYRLVTVEGVLTRKLILLR